MHITGYNHELTERTIHISNGGKKEVFDQICFHLGKIRGGYAIEAGKEVADVMEKLKSGEIKGAEEFADDEKALSTIAGTYINNTSKNIYDMDLVPNARINLLW